MCCIRHVHKGLVEVVSRHLSLQVQSMKLPQNGVCSTRLGLQGGAGKQGTIEELLIRLVVWLAATEVE